MVERRKLRGIEEEALADERHDRKGNTAKQDDKLASEMCRQIYDK